SPDRVSSNSHVSQFRFVFQRKLKARKEKKKKILISTPPHFLLVSQILNNSLQQALSPFSPGRYRVLRSRSDLRPLKGSNPVDLCSHSCAEGIQIATQTWAFCLLKCSLPCLGTRKLGSLSLDWTMLGKLLFSIGSRWGRLSPRSQFKNWNILLNQFFYLDAAIGFNVETVQYNNIKFQVWDLGMAIFPIPYLQLAQHDICYFAIILVSMNFKGNALYEFCADASNC
ncbi:hypothetical protein Prudu_000752, partial [Prunus dulcis]